MNRSWCERESDAVRSLRTGLLSPKLHAHVLSCTICTEAQAAAQMMLQTASLVHVKLEPPAAGLVWRRAEARRKEIALKRATRPLVFMRVLSAVYVVLSATWLLHYFWRPDFVELLSGWNVFGSESAWFTGVIALLAIAIGAGYLLHDGRRSGEVVPSTSHG
jgi:hypothetical protein